MDSETDELDASWFIAFDGEGNDLALAAKLAAMTEKWLEAAMRLTRA